MGETVKLMNMKRQMRSFNLEHPDFVNKNGEHPVGRPETLTMLPREVKVVPKAALECSEIRAALRPLKGRPTLRVLS